VYFLTSTNVNSFPKAQITVEANNALDRLAALIFSADHRWQFDDTNQTDLPIATTALVANQQDYSIITAFIEITRAEIKDSSGNWNKLMPLDQTDVYNQSLTDFMKTAGLPVYYDKIANSVFLYPKPNYSQADSLKLYFKRGPSYFIGDGSDDTKTPGINTLFQDLIPYWIAYNFAIANGKKNAPLLKAEIDAKEDSLREHYALRDKDDRPRLQARRGNYK
jgi:hypothetical protein